MLARWRLRVGVIVTAAGMFAACATAGSLKPIAQPTKILVTDQNGNAIAQISDASRLQQLTSFINRQRTQKQWRIHEPAPISDIVLHLCRAGELESVFGMQTRLFSSDHRDTPAQPEEVDQLLTLLSLDRSLFARVPLKQGHTDVSCH